MAGRISGITIEIGGDTTKLQKALSDVNKQVRTTSNDLRDINKLLKLDPGNADLLAQKQKTLASAIEATKQKLQEMKAITRDQVSSDQEWDALQREIVETEQKLKGLESEYQKFGSVAAQQVAAAGEKMKDTGAKIESAGKAMLPVSAAVAGAGAAAVKTAADFESSMKTVQSTSGASEKDLAALEKKAREMGKTTKFSASEAAEAMNYMAMAGWKTEDMVSGLDGVMQLAAASGEDLASTSDIITDGLTAFGLKAKDAGKMADIMAAASSNANTNVAMMGETFKYAAPVAGSLGFTMQDTAVAIGLMANAGIKSSQAGTSLRAGLTNLVNPSEKAAAAMEKYGIEIKNSDGSMKSLQEIMTELRTKMGGLSEAEQAAAASSIFGKNAMSGWLAVINASDDDFNKLTKAINNSDGAAKKMADIKMDSLEGQLKILQSALQELGISIGQTLLPYITKFVQAITGVVNFINGLPEPIKNIIIVIGLVVAALGPLLIIVGKVVGSIGTIMTWAPQIVSAFGTFATFITGTAVPAIQAFITAFGPIIAVVAGVSTALASFIDMFRNGFSVIKEILMGVGVALAAVGAVLLGAPAAVAAIIAAIVFAVANFVILIKNHGDEIIKWFCEQKEKIAKKWDEIKSSIGTKIDEIKKSVSEKWQKIKDAVSEKIDAIKESVSSTWNTIKSTVSEVVGTIKGVAEKGFDAIGSKAKSIFNGIKSTVQKVFDNIKKVVSNGVDFLKKIFDFKWELPKLKLPHFSVNGKFSLDPPSIPSFSVSWYKKAYDNAYMLTNPTIFGAAGGKLLGGGDGSGSEMVVGTEKLMSMIKAASSDQGDIIIPVYIGGERIDEMVVNATQRVNYRSGGR